MSMTEDVLKAKHAEAVRKWRKKHPEKVKEMNNSEKRKQYMREYSKKRYRSKKLQLKPMYDRKPLTVGDVGRRVQICTDIFDRDDEYRRQDSHETLEQSREEKSRYKAVQAKLADLESRYDDRKVNLEIYIRERSILLTKLQRYNKHRNDE